MSSLWRRFEVLLPLRFNDGRAVPFEWLDEALGEIVDQFGSASSERQAIEGRWLQGGVLYRDLLERVFVDLPDMDSNREWMRQFKERWRLRLGQLEIWMVSYAIEVE